ncbi:MAG: DUF262 domain-containing protein [Promethearchaeota archaeon]
MPNFEDIPQLTIANYHVNIGWPYLKIWLEDLKIDMNPDFQRQYIWTENQKEQYIEWILKGGQSGKDIYFNHPNWFKSFEGIMVIVDGKQRIDAVLDFLDNRIKAFGYYHGEYEGKFSTTSCMFDVYVADLKHKKDVLQWYIDMNTGGTAHTNDEIIFVKSLLHNLDENK